MGTISFEGQNHYDVAMELALKAKEKREEADELERQSVKSFREFRNSQIKKLQDLEVQEEFMTARDRLRKIRERFCDCRGHHEYVSLGEVQLGPWAPSEENLVCEICGETDNPEIIERRNNQIGKAIASDDNPKLKEIAIMIRQAESEMQEKRKKCDENQEALEELCHLFGHDIDIDEDAPSEGYWCKCCRKRIKVGEYIKTYKAAHFKGDIVPFHLKSNPIM